MPIGPGKYDLSLTKALKENKASEGILLVFDGKNGPSFCCQLSITNTKLVPQLLRDIANQIEKVLNA